ncbi:hypothetical protein E4U42_002334 [Claviceps africana]|uniref:FAD dependent oxidoreductase domain-containing protein n=1 Tax=Claviceps africana TaxID=83212 RepID=A0A8K0JEC7_9HYPO|nr:hypothetical protein E4U42_002334 [Claviceps africana]
MAKSHVVVIGGARIQATDTKTIFTDAILRAGVIGLTAALEISRDHDVTIVATHLPGDWAIEYASPRAGAHFRPTPVQTEADKLEHAFMCETYSKLRDISASDESAGVRFIAAVEYFDKEVPLSDKNMFSAWPNYRRLQASELPAVASIKEGLTYTAWVLNSPVYLDWLQRKVREQGVVLKRATVSAVAEAVFVASDHRKELPVPSTVVNASGTGFADGDCFPSRGQFILLDNDFDRTISHHCADGHATVVIPRPGAGGTVVGGTKEPNNWSPYNSHAAIEAILQRVGSICPDLARGRVEKEGEGEGLRVREAYVGRRPMRRGGLRLEQEMMEFVETADDGMASRTRELRVVHCYGAGPNGYKISWGAARKVAEMVRAS